jgi:nicotinamide-nucleotide amidase
VSEVLARQVGDALAVRGWMLATAESCTGGWVAKVVTDVAGSSGWFERGYVTYTNRSKQEMLGVRGATLDEYGAVSGQTVQEMALGARDRAGADISVAISGIAGPGGGSAEKPVGTIWIAWATQAGVHTQRYLFDGDREAVRRQAMEEALRGVLELATA